MAHRLFGAGCVNAGTRAALMTSPCVDVILPAGRALRLIISTNGTCSLESGKKNCFEVTELLRAFRLKLLTTSRKWRSPQRALLAARHKDTEIKKTTTTTRAGVCWTSTARINFRWVAFWRGWISVLCLCHLWGDIYSSDKYLISVEDAVMDFCFSLWFYNRIFMFVRTVNGSEQPEWKQDISLPLSFCWWWWMSFSILLTVSSCGTRYCKKGSMRMCLVCKMTTWHPRFTGLHHIMCDWLFLLWSGDNKLD